MFYCNARFTATVERQICHLLDKFVTMKFACVGDALLIELMPEITENWL